ncbi:MAG: TrmH family RNA methyltransferase [Myxococcota bacterium]
MKEIRVTRRNTWFQRLETMRRNRQKRTSEGLFVVDSVKALNLLTAHPNWTIDALVYPHPRALSDWARTMLATSRASWHVAVAPELFAELTERTEPPELFAVAHIPSDDIGRIPIPSHRPPLMMVIDRPVSPGNLGTMVRSADAFGVDGIVVFGHAADLYAPETVRASLGTLFTVPVVRMYAWADFDGWIAALRQTHSNAQLIGSSAQEGVFPSALDLTRPTVLVLGNETAGMSRRFMERVDNCLSIPMRGAASSLNIACAATAILYEVARQRLL